MENVPLAPFAQYGLPGLVMGAMLLLFFWAFKRLFNHVLTHQTKYTELLGETVSALRRLNDQIEENHDSIRARFDDITGRIDNIDDTLKSKKKGTER